MPLLPVSRKLTKYRKLSEQLSEHSKWVMSDFVRRRAMLKRATGRINEIAKAQPSLFDGDLSSKSRAERRLWQTGDRLGPKIRQMEDLFVTLQESQAQLGRLHQESAEDSLTRLGTKAYQKAILPHMASRAEREGKNVAYAVTDLDNFKRFQDHFNSHELGDRVLQLKAEAIRRVLRGSDEASRVGGDEFHLQLWNSDAIKAALPMERIRNKFLELVEGDRVVGPKHRKFKKETGLSLDISYGLSHALLSGGKVSDPMDLFKTAVREADERMYEMKKARKAAGTAQR
jgi:diguanylate cyclase (GGDEF)-like protein